YPPRRERKSRKESNLRTYQSSDIFLKCFPRTYQDKKEHEEHLKAILELLKKEKLYAKFSKCDFGSRRYNFSVMSLIAEVVQCANFGFT
ncbi:hypothetical protein Tco_1189287, partial [Tanacetum coccineum]